MPKTLAEIVAWSTGANWPIDGEVATEESIEGQIQELKDRSNYLKSVATDLTSKTDQLGWQLISTNRPTQADIISQAVSPGGETALTNSVVDVGTVAATGYKVDIEFGPLYISNAANATAAHVAIQVSQNGGSYADCDSWLIPATVALSVLCRTQFSPTVTGDLKFRLTITNPGTGSVTVGSLNANLSTYLILKQVV
jgi:hypothetical protein